MSDYTLHHGDCLEILPTLEANSVDAIVTDPPYFKVKNEAWDRQWDQPPDFLAWLDLVIAEFHRVLKPNGSLYLFASSKMAARVEMLVTERLNVLNHIIWIKSDRPWNKSIHRGHKTEKAMLRAWWPETERIIFAEHYGADNIAKGEAGYAAKCDELRGFVFEPLRAYLDGERERAGVSPSQIMTYFEAHGWPKYVTARHSFSQSQWELPTAENYQRLRQAFTALNHGGEYLRREYEDLRREYEDLRREYEDLRRPFYAPETGSFTDVWMFSPINGYDGKHPCEKPLTILTHILEASTRPGALVLDCFMGTGSTGVACMNTGRRFIGIELDAEYTQIARRRIAAAARQLLLNPQPLPMWADGVLE